MTLPTPMPGGLLATVLDHWNTNGWSTEDLTGFRMGPDDDVLDGLSDEDIAAIESLSEEDVEKLSSLKPEALAKLTGGGDVDEDELPDPVKKVLKKNRDEARDAKRAKRAAEAATTAEKARADKAEAELARLKKKPPKKDDDGDKPDPAEAIEEARRAANEEATAKANERVIRAEVKAAAGKRFADPALAARLVDLTLITVDDKGEVDEEAITEQLDDILEKNPGLAAKAKTKPKPNSGQGKRGPTLTGADAGKAEAEKRFGKREAAGAK